MYKSNKTKKTRPKGRVFLVFSRIVEVANCGKKLVILSFVCYNDSNVF